MAKKHRTHRLEIRFPKIKKRTLKGSILVAFLLCLAWGVYTLRYKADIAPDLINLDKVHTVLTDGKKATSVLDSDAWVNFTKDADELGTREKLAADQLSSYGLKSIHYNSDIGDLRFMPKARKSLYDANIRDLKYEFYDEEIKEETFNEVEELYNEGFNFIGSFGLLGIIGPEVADKYHGYRQGSGVLSLPVGNGQDGQAGEQVDIPSNTAKLSKIDDSHPLITNRLSTNDNNIHLTDPASTLQNYTDVFPLSIYVGSVFLNHIAKPGTEKVYVSESGQEGDYRQITRYNQGDDSQSGIVSYDLINEKEITIFGFFYHNTENAKIKVEYQGWESESSIYMNDIDYSVDPLTGIVTKKNNSFSTPFVDDKFEGSALGPQWKTMNEPQNLRISDGKLIFSGIRTTTFGEFVYQDLNGSGNFYASMKKSTAYTPSLTVYQDDLNWLSYDGIWLIQVINGVKSSSCREVWSGDYEVWINIKKVGDSYTFYRSDKSGRNIEKDVFYVSGSEAFFGNRYFNKINTSYDPVRPQTLNGTNLKIGVSVDHYPKEAVVDEFILRPGINLSGTVRAYYSYLYYDRALEIAKNLAEKYKDYIYYWENIRLPYHTYSGMHEYLDFSRYDSFWSQSYALGASVIANKYLEAIKLGNPDAKVIGDFAEYPHTLHDAYYDLAKAKNWNQFDLNTGQAASSSADSYYSGSSRVVDFSTIFNPFIDNNQLMTSHGFGEKPYIDTKYGFGNTYARLDSDYQGLADLHTQNQMFGKKANSLNSMISTLTWGIYEHPLLSCHNFSKRKVNLERKDNIVTLSGYEIQNTCGNYATNLNKGDKIFLTEASDNTFNGEFTIVNNGQNGWDPKTYTQTGEDAKAVAYVETATTEAALMAVARNAGKNKGVILDLGERVDYLFGQDPDPSKTKKQVKRIEISSKDRSDIDSIKIKSSLTNTDDNLTNSGGSLMQYSEATIAGGNPAVGSLPNFPIYFDANHPNFREESILLTGISTSQYRVSGTISGDLGVATQEVPFTSNNGAITMTIPPKTEWGAPVIRVGDTLWAHLFKGDGYKDVTEWTNTGQSGTGSIVINLSEAILTRYLQFEFYKKDGSSSFSLDEIEVFDNSNTNISIDKLYLAEGAIEQPSLFSGDTTPPQIEAMTPPEKGAVIDGNSTYTEIRYKVDGIEKTKQIRISKGNNTYTIKARDKAGNISEKTLEFFVTSLPPVEVNILSPQEGGIVYRDKIQVVYEVDGELKQKDATLILGPNKIEIIEKNADGLPTKKEINLTYEEPTVAPVIKNITPENNSDLYIYAEQNEYIGNITYEVDGFTVLLLDQKLAIGENTIPISETNKIGTTSIELKYNVIKISRPTIYIESPANGTRTKEDHVDVVYYVDGERRVQAFGLQIGDNDLTVYGYNQFYTAYATVHVVRDETITPPAQTFSSGWNMVTFPMIDESLLGSVLPDTFKVRRFNTGDNRYDKAEEVEVIPTPGLGYWMKIDDIAKIESVKYKSNSAATSTAVRVSKGWNLLGNPFLADLPLGNLNIRYTNGVVKNFADAVKAKDIAGYAWSWEGTANPKQYYFISNDPNRYKTSAHKQTFVSPFRGFWIVIKKTEVSEIIINQ